MQKQKTMRSLLLSLISLVMSLNMLVGSTFAWFSDSVTSANNVIKSGNLDVSLEYWDEGNAKWKDVKNSSDILSGNHWEPGYVDVAYLKMKNTGSLGLKYKLGVNIVSETSGVNLEGKEFNLSDYIYFDVVNGVNGETDAYASHEDAMKVATRTTKISEGINEFGTLNPSEEVVLALVVYMPTTDVSEANPNEKNIPRIDLGINVAATQYTYETDSFGSDYDSEASLPVVEGEYKQKFKTKFTGDFTYKIGNKNSVALEYLFSALDSVEIDDSNVIVEVERVDSGSSVSGAFTGNTNVWESKALSFTGTGVVKVTITDNDNCAPTKLYLEVVDGYNHYYDEIYSSSAIVSNLENAVLLCDTELNSVDKLTFNGKTVHGNGFTIDCTKGLKSGMGSVSENYLIRLIDAHIDNVKIIGDVYPLYDENPSKKYNRALVLTTGDCTITNSYLSNTASPIRLLDGSLVVKDSIVEGGSFKNIDVRDGTLTTENVTTRN